MDVYYLHRISNINDGLQINISKKVKFDVLNFATKKKQRKETRKERGKCKIGRIGVNVIIIEPF